ncbi:hypothetical protein MPSEU_000730300 [Mayamaea pseudoterrestris]|nr:hypothetical protein MPSEU_000730300 [Mayamaea pseudoterrestris]
MFENNPQQGGRKRTSGNSKTPRSSTHTDQQSPTSPRRATSKPSSSHSNETRPSSSSPSRSKKSTTPASTSKPKARRHSHEEETPRASDSNKKRSDNHDANAAAQKSRPFDQHVHDNHQQMSPLKSEVTPCVKPSHPYISYFSKLGQHHRTPLPLCPSRKRVQGTRGNGAIHFFIDMDTPGGHQYPALVLVQGIEMYDSDSDGGNEQHQRHARRSAGTGRTLPSRPHPQRPPTPPKPSQKRSTRNRAETTFTEENETPISVGTCTAVPRTSHITSPPELPKRQVSDIPAPQESQPSTTESKGAETIVDSAHNSALLHQLWKQAKQQRNDRNAPVPRDSGTLAETLENSIGSASWRRRDEEDNGEEDGGHLQSTQTFEESPSRQEWTTTNGASFRRQEQDLHISVNLSEEEEDEYIIGDTSLSDDEEEDETSESDDADDHVKNYINNYVQTQFHARLAKTISSSASREESLHEEEESIDPLADFAARHDDDTLVDDSLADIEHSFAVASMDDYSAPSVDYGYNEDVTIEQAESASSISAKELEPVKLNPVLVSPASNSESTPPSTLRRPIQIISPKSSKRQVEPAENGHASSLQRPTQAQIQPVLTSTRRSAHASTDLKLKPSSKDEPRIYRGSKKPASRVRQPSMIDARSTEEQQAKAHVSSGHDSFRRRNNGSSGALQHSHTSMGSSGSDSSPAFQTINPYAMPESVLDQSMAFMQFDFRAEAGVTRCETNEDVQVAESSEDGSIDEFDATMLHKKAETLPHEAASEIPELEVLELTSQRAAPRLPVRNKTNEDMPQQMPPQQRGLRGLVRNISNRETVGNASVLEALAPTGAGRGALMRSLSTEGSILSPKRGIMRNFSNRAGRSTGSERTDESIKRKGLFRAPKNSADKDGTKDLVRNFFGNASCNNLSTGNRVEEAQDGWLDDEASLLVDDL